VLLLLLFYVGLAYMDPPIEKGIAINFGTTDYGSGKVQPKQKIESEPYKKPITPPVEQEKVEEVAEVVPEKTAVKNTPTQKILTQESEESVVIKQREEAKRKALAAKKKAQAAQVARKKRAAQEKIKREKDAKKKKLDQLMGGLNKSNGSASGSEGDDNTAGDKGNVKGNPYATSYYGSPGTGAGGAGGYGLNGRSIVGKGKVEQNCNQEGRVVVKIVVGKNGTVISATPGVKGTTNNHPCLLEPAKKTALKHKWNLDSNAPNKQVGFVVVNFKLGE